MASVVDKGWRREFDNPITLPAERIVTLERCRALHPEASQ
jgi:hypothetical protein